MLQTQQPTPVTSITSLVIRVLPLMTQVCSTAHTFPFKWFVLLERTPSSPKLDLRPATVLFPTHSPKEPRTHAVVNSSLTRTATIVALPLRTSCDSSGCCGSGCPTCPYRPPARGVFFYGNKYLKILL